MMMVVVLPLPLQLQLQPLSLLSGADIAFASGVDRVLKFRPLAPVLNRAGDISTAANGVDPVL